MDVATVNRGWILVGFTGVDLARGYRGRILQGGHQPCKTLHSPASESLVELVIV